MGWDGMGKARMRFRWIRREGKLMNVQYEDTSDTRLEFLPPRELSDHAPLGAHLIAPQTIYQSSLLPYFLHILPCELIFLTTLDYIVFT